MRRTTERLALALALWAVLVVPATPPSRAEDPAAETQGLCQGVELGSGAPTVSEQSALAPDESPAELADASSSARPEATAAVSTPAPSQVIADGEPPARLGGRWRKLPESPFASAFGSAVWTGREMVVIAGDTKKVAGYDPKRRRWTEYPKAPHRPYIAAMVWTGREVITPARRGRGSVVRVLAFDPDAETWRELPESPISWIGDAVWTGEMVVAASGGPRSEYPPAWEGPQAAAYDPVRDCWTRLPDVPGEPYLHGLHWAGDRVLAVTYSNDRALSLGIAILDPETMTWKAAAPSPLLDDGEAGIWTGTELVFLTREKNEDDTIYNGAYSPSTDTWRLIDPACEVWADDAVWTGELIITQTRWAVEPVSGACVRIPPRHDRIRTEHVRLWTGREVIEWSGMRGDDMTTFPDGLVYRPRR